MPVMDFQWEMTFVVIAVGVALGGIMLKQGAFLCKEIVELRQRMESNNAELRSENTALRAKMDSDHAALRSEIIKLRERFVRVEVTLEMIRTGFWPQRNTEGKMAEKQAA